MIKLTTLTLCILIFSKFAASKETKPMIELKELLTLPVSAASGLLKIDEDFYTVSDDELKLYKISKKKSIESFQLISGKLPDDHAERKNKKPDFESLYFYKDKIFAMPSLSRPNRIKAANFTLKNQSIELTDLAVLYQKAQKMVDELNIEGSAMVNDELWLFQRGNGKKGINGIFKLNPENFGVKDFQKIELGKMKEHNLGFTDAVFANGHVYFVAVVETGKSTYDDGKYLGAVLGKMDLSGKILRTIEIESLYKPEGLAISGGDVYIVTDADNREITSRLYKGKLPQGL